MIGAALGLLGDPVAGVVDDVGVVAGATRHAVAAFAAVEQVVAAEPREHVAARGAEEPVGPGRAGDGEGVRRRGQGGREVGGALVVQGDRVEERLFLASRFEESGKQARLRLGHGGPHSWVKLGR